MMDVAKRLAALCWRGHRDMGAPMAVLVGSHPMLVATDGTMYAGIRSREAGADGNETIRTKLAEYLSGDVPQVVTATSAEDIAAWAGDPAWKSPCPQCDGKGMVSAECELCDAGEVRCTCTDCGDYHFRTCSDCDGQGNKPGELMKCCDCKGAGTGRNLASSPKSAGRCAGVVVDKRRLARLLTVAEGDCVVWVSGTTPNRDIRLNIQGNGWRLGLMSLQNTAPADEFLSGAQS